MNLIRTQVEPDDACFQLNVVNCINLFEQWKYFLHGIQTVRWQIESEKESELVHVFPPIKSNISPNFIYSLSNFWTNNFLKTFNIFHSLWSPQFSHFSTSSLHFPFFPSSPLKFKTPTDRSPDATSFLYAQASQLWKTFSCRCADFHPKGLKFSNENFEFSPEIYVFNSLEINYYSWWNEWQSLIHHQINILIYFKVLWTMAMNHIKFRLTNFAIS